jgi:lipopolysaccharide/colanic/teichoic acid biosynthesis glycosyltransferase
MSHVIAAEPDSRIEFSALSGLQLLDLRPVYFTRKQEMAKLIFDWIAASIGVLLLSPVLVLLALLVKFTSPGPLLYRSWRVGRGGRHFVFYKFRSMYHDADKKRAELAAQNQNNGHLFKIKNDPRITPLGRFMRRYSLDELPQLFNVLLGDMSLVGPRPLPSSDLAPDGSSNRFATWAEQRSCVLPGITGLWQIRGRSDLSFQEMMELDTYYIRSWSLKLDIQILLETPLVVVLGRGAY